MLVKLFSRCKKESIIEFTLASAAATRAWRNIRDLPICIAKRSVGVGEVGLGLAGGTAAFVSDVLGVEGEDGRASSSS